MSQIIYKHESYFVIGLCMNVHNELGKGFSEAVYGDALEIELKSNGVPFQREVKFNIEYKGKTLKHQYYADFIVDDKIILELKAIEKISSGHIKQTMNYLAASQMKLGLIVNFGEDQLTYKRVLL
ncbi:GxxExxY protein [Flagellimonas taeanensis]|uniref:GxxExxY protein n=1 Tax=Flagellimonas taeanensis TaxID=1005926 RepID=A0A3A1NW64_9FLAO|nr:MULTISPECIES: GxxExxY protein [Allomuricauda]MDC6384333.1 GxxExxY protein [Muricauda sp. SK9]RIV49684.1 GxxExxY protein [Allomuricauda taeanensis]RIV53883.1 GxxExxY protein [Allomuricauda taeanensis]SFB91810.1 GxxExxY protein [Allomuricauda taeanensis]SHK62989.1 GxxExxY protein [Allomuricauda taeanensis]